MAEIVELEWVSVEQQALLDQLWEIRGDWREWLPEELDAHWPQWREAAPDDLAPWLDGLIPGLMLPEAEVSVEEFGWLRDDQIAALNQVWEARGDWQKWLPGELDAVWPQWRQGNSEDLTAWFDQILPGLVAPAPDAATEEAGDRLGWVTGEQTAQLVELYGESWRDDLAGQLDTRWGEGWEANPAAHKQAWLDGLLPTLAMAGADLEDVGSLLDDEAVRAEELVFTVGE